VESPLSRKDPLGSLLRRIIRAGLLLSTAVAGLALVLGVTERWPGSATRRELIGLAIVAANLLAYRYREWLCDLEARRGVVGVAISLGGGLAVFLDGAGDNPYFPAILVGVGLTAGTYVGGLALNGHSPSTPVEIINATAPFMLALTVGGTHTWLARFVNLPELPATPAPVGDARQILMRDTQRALESGPTKPRRPRLLPGTPDETISTLSIVDRVSRLSDEQREIFRLYARGLSRTDIAEQLYMSASKLYRLRLGALQAAHARTGRQLAAMVAHVDHPNTQDPAK
jgi:DNA-binding CsgD family transcriptional regulator